MSALRVPQYQNTEGLAVPSVPVPQQPTAVKAAFGGDIHAANEEIAGQIGKVAGLLQKRVEERQKVESETLNQQLYSQHISSEGEFLFSTDQKEVEYNGQKVNIPAGGLNRQGWQAEGLLYEYDQFHNSQMTELLEKAHPRYRGALHNSLNSHYNSQRRLINKYESDEWNKDKVSQYGAGIKSTVSSSYLATDPLALATKIEEVALQTSELNEFLGVEGESAKANIQKNVYDVTSRAIAGALEKDKSGLTAGVLHDAISGVISKESSDKLKKDIRDSVLRMKKEAEVDLEEQQIQNEADLLMGLADKKIDKAIIPQISNMISAGKISRDIGNAFIKVLQSPGLIDKPKKIEKSGFTKYAKDIFNSKDTDEQRKALVRMLEGSAGGKLNEEQMGVLIKAAMGDNKKSLISGIIDAFSKMTVGLNFSPARMTYDLIKAINDGAAVEEARRFAIDNEQIRSNPNRTQYSVGDSVETPIGLMYVWGYYEDGEPDVRKERPPKNETK